MAKTAWGTGSGSVYLEAGSRRVFACSLEWPGWCRSGKDEARALEALVAAAPRYAAVAATAGLMFPTGEPLGVVERLAGSATTDFGAPGEIASGDTEPLLPDEADRVARLVAASWEVFDDIVAGTPAGLRKGPRGGGRDRDAIVDHVLGAEVAYARKLGIRLPQPALTSAGERPPVTPRRGDRAAVTALRSAIGDALRSGPQPTAVAGKGWPPRYAARRIAWHVLDHAWEIEDRRLPG